MAALKAGNIVPEPAPAAPAANVPQGVELAGLCKTYSGLTGQAVQALSDVDLNIGAGEVVGVAGPNGAGKSTLLSILTGFLAPTAGTARVHGLEPRAYARRFGVAYLPELVRLPPHWTVATALRRLGELGGLSGETLKQRAAAALEELGLAEQAAKRVGRLSKGNLQRLGIAQMLLSDSDLMIFDEPSNGLDPVWLMRFRELVAKLRRPGRLIVIASHNLDELERLTDSVVILGRGRVERVVRHSAAAQSAAAAGVFRLKLLKPCGALAELFPGALPVQGRENEYKIEIDAAALSRSEEHTLNSSH